MALITSQTQITILDALDVVTQDDFVLQPENSGVNAVRELRYPNNTFAPLIYSKNPDLYTNFDTSPLVKRPRVSVLPTLEDNRITGWQGFTRDTPITETWNGSDTEAPMPIAFFRQLYTYFENPPIGSFITWHPKDRTNDSYNIVIESLTVNGAQITFAYVPARNGWVTGDVVLTFRIVSQV